eukprot:CAMPEP_0202400858 /NCGR_PEP_ID=MMETSP1128-20130828/3061_1 /ASSEMBLY_ACC=CAM_ASM_000463 /TAXON_ID=3047 /ORGANISM="Dunaliella tertiolecta, Strain CCMP1320" /LENGTH=178 /DNA_ID=CAMNT_0049004535 /DNA_START=208 /DNA_END=746 /DNA_ORIENTATION=-
MGPISKQTLHQVQNIAQAGIHMEEQQARESQADLARMQAVRGHALARETAEAAGNTHRAMLNEGIHFATSSRKHLEAVGALRTHMEPSMRQAASDIFDAAGAIMDEKERTQQGLPPGPSGNSSGEPKGATIVDSQPILGEAGCANISIRSMVLGVVAEAVLGARNRPLGRRRAHKGGT